MSTRIDADALARAVAELPDDDIISFARALVSDLGERDARKLHTFVVAMDAAFDLVDPSDDALAEIAANDEGDAPGKKSPSADRISLTRPKRGDDSVH